MIYEKCAVRANSSGVRARHPEKDEGRSIICYDSLTVVLPVCFIIDNNSVESSFRVVHFSYEHHSPLTSEEKEMCEHDNMNE